MRLIRGTGAAGNLRAGRERGVALVIILAFVVLLTVLVLAYFSYSSLQRQISNSSATQAAASIFADGTVNTILGDLREEIANGSTVVSITNGASVTNLYFPSAATNAVPSRVGSATNLANLVKRSTSGQAFSPGGTNRAANLSSTNASQNGRLVTKARWNAPLLLPKANTNSATDLTPVVEFLAPDWILVARDGSNPTTWNTDMRSSKSSATTVVGRYAYAIYDEGGLLDMNVAGYPPGSSTNFTADKGSLAYADVTVIPGMSTNAVSAIVGWRNYASAKPGGTFPSFTYDGTSQTNYFQSVLGNTSGYMRTANTNISAGQSDRKFVSRQQLIKLLTEGVATNATDKAALQNALQYLSMFSRDLEQPSFRPHPDRPKNTTKELRNPQAGSAGGAWSGFGGNDAYRQQDVINPSLLSARTSSNAPVLKQRFPLARLALVTPAPTTENAEKIKKYFGLVWDAGACRWVYTSPDGGSTAATSIKTLDQIAPLNREPDFFETLKAVINCDSLGKQHGGNEPFQNPGQSPHSFLSNGAAIDGRVDYQIMQIGAALFDQYDADSYPTRIQFDTNAAASYPREFYGIENIPNLAGFMTAWYRLQQLSAADIQPGAGYQPPGGAMPFETAVFVQPILWNPHAPDTRVNPPDVPTEFQIQAGDPVTAAASVLIFPQVQAGWWPGTPKGGTAPDFYAKPARNYPASTGAPLTPDSYAQAVVGPIDDTAPVSYIRFLAAPGSFLEPHRLHAPNDPPGSATTASSMHATTDLEGGAFSQALGIYVGTAWTGPSSQMSPEDPSLPCLVDGNLTSNLRYHLQYKNPYGATPAYLTYDVITDAYHSSSSQYSTVASDDTVNRIRGMRTGFRYDPRTNRWGLPTTLTSPTWDSRFATWSGVGAKPPWIGSYRNQPLFYFPQGMSIADSAASMITAIGSPSIQSACAPGWKRAPQQPLADLELNYLTPDNSGSQNKPLPGNKMYYADPDGVLRRGSAAYFDTTTKDGLAMKNGNMASRPVILNRPFRSVADMGYAFRGVAWKNIDFFTPESGDSALLDAFCVNELDSAPDDVVVAGRVNLNTRQPKVLEAIIRGVSKAEGGTVDGTEAAKAAQALVDWTSDTTTAISGILSRGPLANRSELVGKWVSGQTFTIPDAGSNKNLPLQTTYDGSKSYSGYSSLLTGGTGGIFANVADSAVQRRRESIMRALADSGNTRTWNLLIDVVAQVGKYPPHASSLNQFVVEGETRYWVHLAIDRLTGNVVAKQLETVSE